MEKRKCLHCNNPIPENKRADSKFCSNSCKAWYWAEHKDSRESIKPQLEIKQELKIAKGTPLAGLRGVIDNTPKVDVKPLILSPTIYPLKPVSDCLPTDIKIENPEYKVCYDKKVSLETEIQREESILLDIAKRTRYLESDKNYRNDYRTSKNFKTSSDMYLLQDFFTEDEEIIPDSEFENNKQIKLKELKGLKEGCLKMLDRNRLTLKEVLGNLSKIPRYEVKQNPKFNFADLLKSIEASKTPTKPLSAPIEMKEPETKENEATLGETQDKIEITDRIISSKELMDMDYKSLGFKNRWKDFLGQPAEIFHFAIHGLPGGGKSTFCLQLADYLADDYGNVIYVSGEEGYSKTLKDKVILTKADSDNLYFHDAKNIGDIRENVPADQYHFIFIDSLDTLRIDAIKLRELRKHYRNSALITISQSRKDGKMKGDSEILHDADTIIRVHNGVATLSKNRFNSIADKYFEVFPKGNENKKVKGFSQLKNTI